MEEIRTKCPKCGLVTVQNFKGGERIVKCRCGYLYEIMPNLYREKRKFEEFSTEELEAELIKRTTKNKTST